MSERPFHQTPVEERKRLQEHISELEPRLRRRLRGKLRAIARGPYDLDDVIASARRRVDAAAAAGHIRAQSLLELDAYIVHIAEHVAVQGLRREQRQRRRWFLAARSGFLRGEPTRPEHRLDLWDHLLFRLDQDDRTALELWVRGSPHSAIAGTLGIGLEAHRSRWRRLRTRLRDMVLADEDGQASRHVLVPDA